jgi:hypothetical protein
MLTGKPSEKSKHQNHSNPLLKGCIGFGDDRCTCTPFRQRIFFMPIDIRKYTLQQLRDVEMQTSRWLSKNIALKTSDPKKWNSAYMKYSKIVKVLNWRADFEIAKLKSEGLIKNIY